LFACVIPESVSLKEIRKEIFQIQNKVLRGGVECIESRPFFLHDDSTEQRQTEGRLSQKA
jgi:hypothetical protein